MLQTVSRDKLRDVLGRPEYQARLTRLLEQRRDYLAAPAWFQRSHPQSPLTHVAYFSMEFALSEALPIYSGGLGNVAGDQLKAASDLGVPVVGVGLLYQRGYFRQAIAADGSQEELYPYNDPTQLPISPARDDSGEWIRIPIELPGAKIWFRTWQAKVGRLALYLLDSNDPANPPAARGIASELYGGGPELRLRQELVLGIAGWRLLRALRLEPEVCHLNEGHAAFAVLERARSFMEDNRCPFDVALAVTRAGNLFTTHTPVPAGFDRFDPSLIDLYLRRYAEEGLRLDLHDLLALGRENPKDRNEPFNMAYLAIRGSGAVNGVSRLHGQVSRRIFQAFFPRWPQAEVPVGHVTNGVHTPSWDSIEADALWTTRCGAERWRGTMATIEHELECVADAELWAMRSSARKSLVGYARERMAAQVASLAMKPDEAATMCRCLEPRHAHARLRAAIRHLQTSGHAAPRPGPTGPDPDQSRPSGSARHGGEGASRRSSRSRGDQGLDRVHASSRGARARDLLPGLRSAPGGAARARLRPVDQHAATPVGGERNQRNESARQRRPEPLGARRLVGRGLYARGGVGARGRPGPWRRSRLGRR